MGDFELMYFGRTLFIHPVKFIHLKTSKTAGGLYAQGRLVSSFLRFVPEHYKSRVTLAK